ncbi:hypothetical protein [Comamonas jiangduensis]|uniref:hypothetical protein n=1 Tax=Comamonas jiangduensis TaxID=1194168 RepID=UPI003BF86ECD
MFTHQAIHDLDRSALHINVGEPDSDLRLLDAALWNIVRNLARVDPQTASANFGLQAETVSVLGEISDEQTMRLASGTVCSFKINADAQRIIEALKSPARGNETEFSVIPATDILYWLCVKKISQRSVEVASMAFGLPKELCQLLKESLHQQILELIGQVQIRLTLRHAEGLIQKIVNANIHQKQRDFIYHQSLTKKLQQSLSRRTTAH